MIFLNNVAKYYQGKALFEQINLNVHRGDQVGIVGPNGAGKSTLLGMMEGVIEPDKGEVTVEKRITIGVLHQEILHGNDGPILEEVMNVSDRLRQIKTRLRELEHAMGIASPGSKDAADFLEEHGHILSEFEQLGGYSLEARATKTLQGLGFSADDWNRRWSEFSGGWRMRVALAKILLSEPDALLLDEPTNHLDLESLLWVERYLADFRGALVIVSHDRAFLNKLVTRIVEVAAGRVTTCTGNYDDHERSKETQQEILVAAYKNQQEKIKRIQKFIDQNRVKARTASRAQSRLKMLDKIEKIDIPNRPKKVKFTFPQPQPSGRRVLEISNLVKKYGSKTVYDGFDFKVDKGEKIGLVGPNGAGKSTLLKIMAGVLSPDDGLVNYGHNVKVGYFAQHQSESLNSELTVLQEAHSATPSITEQEVRNILGAFLFSGDDVFKKVKVLSGGEKSRLALTKILLSPPNFLLMDEPTNHLDIPSCEVLEEGLKKFTGTIVLITHDRRLMNGICTGILEIHDSTGDFFPGNYDDFQFKKDLMSKEIQSNSTEVQLVRPVAQASPINFGNKDQRKDKKRKDAQARQVLSKKMAPVKEYITRIEIDLGEKESRRKEIQDLIADPKIYEDKETLMSLLTEGPAISKEISALEEKWETLHTELETLEAESG
ncbi:MAG: ABC-F family ATP-binding cassette domain-containing protein [Desulfomonilaceae bacterium]